MEAWMKDGEKKGNIINALVGKTIEDKKEEYVSQKGIELRDSLERGDSEAVSTIIYDLKDRMGIDPADIRKEVSEYFRPLYYQAYADDDPDAMSDIEDILSDFEIGYDKKTYSSWKNQAKQKYGEDESEEEETEPETDWLNMDGTSGRSINPDLLVAGTGPLPSGLGKRLRNTVDGPDGPFPVMGNIDLDHRATVRNDDGSISTELSFSFYDEDTGKEVLIPTVINGRIVSEDEAIDHYYETGEYLGMFDTPEEANEYAEMLHNRQDWFYNR
jgi:hypothetical protein